MSAPILAAASLSFSTPWPDVPGLLLPAYGQTWAMVGIVMAFVVIVGLPLGFVVHNTSPIGLFPREGVNRVLSVLVNIGRSLPFVILMTAIIPFTIFVVGSTIGIRAAIVPMTIAGIPFFARLVENVLRGLRPEVDSLGVVSGGTPFQIIRSIQLSEALPGVIGAVTLNVVAMIEYSAIAGSIGAGGVGYLAISYGYNRFDGHIMLASVVVLILTVQVVQFVGDRVVRAVTP